MHQLIQKYKKKWYLFAIKGPNNDGNNYADEAIKKGASIALVNKLGKLNKSKKLKQIMC